MGKILRRVLVLIAFILGSSMVFVACENPYQNISLYVYISDEVVYNPDTSRDEFFLEGTTNSFTITAQVTGVKGNVNRGVKISVDQPTEILASKFETSSEQNGLTTARFTVKNGGNLKINVRTNEGGKSLSQNVFIVVPIKEIAFNTVNAIPVVRGVSTDLSNETPNSGNGYKFINFLPSNTNQRSEIKLQLVEENEQVEINGSKIKVAANSTISNFQIIASYNYHKKGGGVDVIKTQPITVDVLTPFSQPLLKDTISVFNEVAGQDIKLNKNTPSEFAVSLATNKDARYSEAIQAMLAFKEKGEAGEENINILDESYSYLGTKYSIDLYDAIKNHNTIGSDKNSDFLTVSKVGNKKFEVNHRDVAKTVPLDFYVNYSGYENFFDYQVVTVSVSVLAFTENMEVFSDSLAVEKVNELTLFNDYSATDLGSSIFVQILGNDDKILDTQTFSLSLENVQNIRAFKIVKGIEVEIVETDMLKSGTTVYFKNVENEIIVLEENAHIKLVSHAVVLNIPLYLVREKVAWGNDNISTNLFFELDNFKEIDLPLNRFLATWLDNEGEVILPEFDNLKAEDFVVEVLGGEVVKVLNESGETALYDLTKLKLTLQDKIGSATIIVKTPNGYTLTINITVLVNLTHENIYLSFDKYANVEDNFIESIDSLKTYTFNALVGDKQTVLLNYDNKNGTKFVLDDSVNIAFFNIVSSNPDSVYIQNSKELVVANYADLTKIAEITVTITGYSWTGDITSITPATASFEFKFFVKVNLPITGVYLERAALSIFTKDTLNLEDVSSKGEAILTLKTNPKDTTTFNKQNIKWLLFIDLGGAPVKEIDESNKTGYHREGNESNGARIYWELSDDKISIKFWVELLGTQASNISHDFRLSFYAMPTVTEEYKDFYGFKHEGFHSVHSRITATNAVLIEELTPDLPYNVLDFDLREMGDENIKNGYRYFEGENATKTFKYSLNPTNPENNKLEVTKSSGAGNIEFHVDEDKQEISVTVISLGVGENYRTPVFYIILSTMDSQDKDNPELYRFSVRITVRVQDGKDISYELRNEADLIRMRGDNSAYNSSYTLLDNISLTSNWVPIGTKEYPFTGKFFGYSELDGRRINYIISNVTINHNLTNEENMGIGFFGYTKNALIEGVTIKGLSINANGGLTNYNVSIGSLIGYMENTAVIDCVIEDGNGWDSSQGTTLNGENLNIIKKNENGIRYNYSSLDVNALAMIGGLAGTQIGGLIYNTTVKVRISTTLNLPEFPVKTIVYAGGLVGYLQASDINDVNAFAVFEGLEIDADIINQKFNIYYSPSLVGNFKVITLINAELSDDMSMANRLNSNSAFGGVVGLNNGKIQGVNARNIIFGKNNLGGLAGVNGGIIDGCLVSPTLHGQTNIGGAVGLNASGMIEDNGAGLSKVYGINYVNGIYRVEALFNSLLGAVYNTKVQMLDHKDSFSVLNTAIAGVNNLGGLVGLNLSQVVKNESNKTFDFMASLSFNSVYSYVSEIEITNGWDRRNDQHLYYGDIIVTTTQFGQTVGGYVGGANNLFVNTSYVKINISNNNKITDIVIGGMLGKIINSSQENKGVVLIFNSSVSGYVAYSKVENDTITYFTENQHNNVGGFLGDSENVYNNLLFNDESAIFDWTYNQAGLFGFRSEDTDKKFTTFYNLQASYTTLKFYSNIEEDVKYIQNFAGGNETENVELLKYGLTISKPKLLAANSFYIGYKTYARYGNEITQILTFNENLVRYGGNVDYFIFSETGTNVLYINNGNIASEPIATGLTVNWTRVNEDGEEDIFGEFYRSESTGASAGMTLPIKAQALGLVYTGPFDVYNTSWHYDNLNMSHLTASLYSNDINAKYYLTQNASVLEGKNIYMHEDVNGGWAIPLAETKTKDNGAINFIVDLPTNNMQILFLYSVGYQSEEEVVIEYNDNYNKVDIQKLNDTIVLSCYQVDKNLLPEIFGYYDFNGDRSHTPTQTERIYTSYLNAYLKSLNKYKLSNLLEILNDGISNQYDELNIYSNSNLINIEYGNGEVYINVLGTGKAYIYITSKYNLTVSERIEINIINKISNLSLFGDMLKINKLSESTPLNIIKSYDKILTITLDSYLENVTPGLTEYYGDIALSGNTKFGVGARFYVLNNEGSPYHASLNIPTEFSINGQKFSAYSGPQGWLIYVDCYDISTVHVKGYEKAKYNLMALPFAYDKQNLNTITLIADNTTSFETQGEKFAINIIDGTFGIGASEDAGSSPTTPANFEVVLQTDDINVGIYISIKQLERYMYLYGLNQVNAFSSASGVISSFYKDGYLVKVSDTLLFHISDSDILVEFVNNKRMAFNFDKFVVYITNLQYLDANNEVLFDASTDSIDDALNTSGMLASKRYSFQVDVEDRYLYDIAMIEEFNFDFYTVKYTTENEKIVENVILDEFKYTINPSLVEEDNVSINHFSKITLNTVDTTTGQKTIITDIDQNSMSNTLVAGYPGLLNINLYPSYARVDSLTVSSSISGGIYVGLEQMLADFTRNTEPDIYPEYIFAGSYSSIAEGTEIIDNGRGIRLINSSYNFVENNINQRGYNGKFYIKTLLPSFHNPLLVFTITVVGYLNGQAQFTKTINITPHLTPYIDFNVGGETNVAVAIGKEVELTLYTDGKVENNNMFDFFIENEKTTLASEKTKSYIFNGIRKVNENKYAFIINYDENLLGKQFSITVTAFNEIFNNIYEERATINFQLALFTVTSISVDRVEEGNLKGNFNQDYALEVKVNADYCTDKALISRNEADEIQKQLRFDTVQKHILREIDKLSASITSLGLYGKYRDFNNLTEEQITDWQISIARFGDGTVNGIRHITSTWYNNDQPLTVGTSYHGFVVSNGRAKFLVSDVKDLFGNSYREPYAVLNVRSTAIGSNERITARALIQYSGEKTNGVGLFDDNNVTSGFVFEHESDFGFDTVQLSNEENPEPIYSVTELMSMQADGHYILMEDLEVNFWTPLKTNIASLDGNGYVIRINSFIDVSSEENEIKEIGLFGVVHEDTLIKNLIVEIAPADKLIDETRSGENLATVDLEIIVHSYENYKIGIIAGVNNGTITNSMVLSNADDYRFFRDDLLISNGKLTQLELFARQEKYFSTKVNNSAYLYNLNRTSSIIKVRAINSVGSGNYRMSGFVGHNNGYITNSAVENITLQSEYYISGFVCENSGSISSSYFKGGNIVNTKQDTVGFTQDRMGTAGFVVINNANAEINYSYVLGRDTTNNERDISGLYNGSKIDKLVGYNYTLNSLTRDTHSVRMYGSVISSVKFAGGFIYRNAGLVTNSYVNSVVLGDECGGFVYINTTSGIIKNTYAIATIYKEETYSSPFSGVTTDKNNMVISLDAGVINNSYYLKMEVTDYQDIYEEQYRQWLVSGNFPENDLFLGETFDGDIHDIINQEKYIDVFSTNTMNRTSAASLTFKEFGAYTSFATFSFNEDHELNGESVATSVWFIPRENNNTANKSQTIARYFKHNSYKANIPQLVSANLRTTSLRYSNFIKHLPEDASVITVLDTLFNGMNYDEAYNIQYSLASLQGFEPNLYVLLRLLYEYPNRIGTYILNEYSLLTGDNSYVNAQGAGTIEKKLEYVFGRYSITNNIEALNAPTGNSHFSLLSNVRKAELSLEILINTINTINSTNIEDVSSFYYSFITRDNNNVDISYGGGVLNPYLVSSVEKFNVYVLQINTQGQETTFNQAGALRLIKTISYNNTNEIARTYRTNFYGDFEGNGLYINDLRIIADNDDFVTENKIEHIGLFGTIGENADGKRGNVRNLNIFVQSLRAAAVKYVGVLAGEIYNSRISNINVTSNTDVTVTGLNVVGGIAGRIYGDSTTIANVSASISVHARYYNSVNNFSAINHTDYSHLFYLYDLSNVSRISYAGGIAGIMEARGVEDDIENAKINANVRGNEVYGNIRISGEVVGGLYGYLGKNSIVSHSRLIANENTRLNGSAIAGGLVGHSLGIVTKSEVENNNQTAIDNEIYNLLESDTYKNISTININIPSTGATSLYIGNPHYIGGIVGLSLGSIIQFSNNRVDVSNINAKYAGGVVGISIGTWLSNIYTTASAYSFTAYGGVIGLQTRFDNNNTNLINSGSFKYAINNTNLYQQISKVNKNLIQMESVVAATIWKTSHKVLNRSLYGIDAPRAQMGSFIGKALSYMENYAYYQTDNNGDIIAGTEWYDFKQNTLSQRMKNESIFFMQAYQENNLELIYEIGNATSNAVNLLPIDKKFVENGYHEIETGTGLVPYFMVVNAMQYVHNNVAYAYSGDISTDIYHSNDYSAQFYRYSRLQNYGSLRTLKEIFDGIYTLKETAVNNLNIRIFGRASDSEYKTITQEYEPGEVLENVSGAKNYLTGDNNPQFQEIYNNWRRDTWFGITMFDGRRELRSIYLFPSLRTKVYQEIIYVYTLEDLRSNFADFPSATYIIMADIALTTSDAEGWVPLGSAELPFSGTLKTFGNYRLYNMSTLTAGFDSFGLFAYTYGATFYNIKIDVGRVLSNSTYMGILAGSATKTYFQGITVTGDISIANNIETNAEYLGGVVGKATDCYFDQVKVENMNLIATHSSVKMGGVVGAVDANESYDMRLSRALNGMRNTYVQNMIINTNTIVTSTPASHIGGLIGKIQSDNDATFELFQSAFYGDIVPGDISNAHIGGVVGYADYINMQYVGAEGKLKASTIQFSKLGGIFGGLGRIDNAPSRHITIAFVINNFDIIISSGAENHVGGLIGVMQSGAADEIRSSYSTGTLSIQAIAGYAVGGLIGSIKDSDGGITIADVYSMSKTSLFPNKNNQVGGIVGKVSGVDASAFENAIYVYDFMPNSNDYGKPISSLALRNADANKLKEYGLVGESVWKKESNGYYPLLNNNFFGNMQREGTVQNPRVSSSIYFGTDEKAIIFNADCDLSSIVLENKTLYLTGNYHSTTGLEFKIDNTSAVFGLNITDSKINNSGIISRSLFYQQDSPITSNGFLVYSRVVSSVDFLAEIEKQAYFSYVKRDGIVTYYNRKSEPISLSPNAIANINEFVEKDYDFENIWTVILGNNDNELIINNLPIFRWEIENESECYWKNSENNLYLDESTLKVTISTPGELAAFAKYINAGGKLSDNAIITLDQDINLTGKEWTPIGTSDKPFTYKFNGNGFTISHISSTLNQNSGLFGVVGNASIENLTVKDSIILDGSFKSNAGLVALAIGNINLTNVYLVNNQIAGGNAGGFIGHNTGNVTIQESYNNNKFTYGVSTGGFVGTSESEGSINIINSYLSNGDVTESEKNRINVLGAKNSNIVGVLVGTLAGKMSIKTSYNSTNLDKFVGDFKASATIQSNSNFYSIASHDEKVVAITTYDLQADALPGFDWSGIWSRNTLINNNYPSFFTRWLSSIALPNYYQNNEEIDNREHFIPSESVTQDERDFYIKINSGVENIQARTILIYTASQLSFISKMVNMGGYTFENWNIMLVAVDKSGNANSINLDEKSWYAIGYDDINNPRPFSGNIYGWNDTNKDKAYITIENATVTNPNKQVTNPIDYLGLFGYVLNANIGYINLINAHVRNIEGNYVGNLVGKAKNSDIDNIYVGDVSVRVRGKSVVGGVIGYALNTNLSHIENYSSVISQGEYAGGVVGLFESSRATITLNNLKNYGSVTGYNQFIGGILGQVYINNSSASLLVEKLSNYGTIDIIEKTCSNTGGIAGIFIVDNIKSVLFDNLVSIKDINGITNLGGITGELIIKASENVTIQNLNNKGNITGTSEYVAGMIGRVEITTTSGDITVNDITQTGSVKSADNYIAGVFGELKTLSVNTTIENIMFSASVEGNSYVGGVFGRLDIDCTEKAYIFNLFNNDSVPLPTPQIKGGRFIGGIAGQVEIKNANIVELTRLENNLNILSTVNFIGGIFGQLTVNATEQINIDNLVNKGGISGHAYTGGIVGRAKIIVQDFADNELIINSLHNSGEISSDNSFVGGLFGYITSSDSYEPSEPFVITGLKQIAIYNSVNSGTISGGDFIGGLIGFAVNVNITATMPEVGKEYKIINLGEISGANYVGGFVGAGNHIKINGKNNLILQNTGKVIANNRFAGGILGKLNYYENTDNLQELLNQSSIYYFEKNIINYVENKEEILGFNYVGGIVGVNNGRIENVINSGNITGKFNGNYFGGIAGMSRTVIEFAKNSGDISGKNIVGGIVGTVILLTDNNNVIRTRVLNVENNGNVSATINSIYGGLIGELNGDFGSTYFNDTTLYFGVDNTNNDMGAIGNGQHFVGYEADVLFNRIKHITDNNLSELFPSANWEYQDNELHLIKFKLI